MHTRVRSLLPIICLQLAAMAYGLRGNVAMTGLLGLLTFLAVLSAGAEWVAHESHRSLRILLSKRSRIWTENKPPVCLHTILLRPLNAAKPSNSQVFGADESIESERGNVA